MIRRQGSIALLALIPSIALADDFDRLEGRTLAAIPTAAAAEARDHLTLNDLLALPNVLAGVRSPVVVVETDQGNPSRVLVAPGFWSPPPPEGADPDDRPEPVAILILERFATFEAGGGAAPDRLAQGQNVMLFDGFRFDLDSGQVVPEGQGGDLAFVGSEDGEPRLDAIGGASLFVLNQGPEFAEPRPGAPSPGRAIVPTDYAGRYLLHADGSQTGTLDLAVNGRAVTGRLRSDQTGTAYEVVGEVEPGTDPAVRFSIQFPRSRQEYSARLFSEGKAAMAGTVLILDRERPFYALRVDTPESESESEPESEPEPDDQP
ncbi:biopolymer transporter ExbD [Tautonia marina]|uniref:biopolymer transporter ExbD n=1 Tax=Tautonia marina TaxID=2653855 RepID=UPI001260ACDB|nr:biopolymer transporter ExbD [Tautonia marina]